jgi:maltose alpha-D-glucosyltransferase/alpha-amylase
LRNCRWFGGKAKTIRKVRIIEVIPVAKDSDLSQVLLLQVTYTEGTQDSYFLPISFALTRKTEPPSEEFVVEGCV